MAAQPETLVGENPAVVIRRATPADAEVCGRICFDAFGTLANKHNFPPDFPAVEIPTVTRIGRLAVGQTVALHSSEIT
jgi:hypothetical protein